MLSRPDKLCGVCEGCDLATCRQEMNLENRCTCKGGGIWNGLCGWDILNKKEWVAWVIWRLKRSEGGGFVFRKPVGHFIFDIEELWERWV